MRLFEAIIEANHRALAGDGQAGIRPDDYKDSMPVVALTCIDPRLNRFFPGVLGLPEDHFIWLRNAGNIITSSLSSTMRSLALACAVKNGHEIAIIGHTDCRIRQMPAAALIDRFKEQGIDRSRLPDNLAEFFGVFASEQQNVIRSVDFVRNSPLIGAKIPVHGLMADSSTGRLEWVVNGYEVLERAVTQPPPGIVRQSIGKDNMDELGTLGSFNLGEMKFPTGKIGDSAPEIKERVPDVAPPAQPPRPTARPTAQPTPPPAPPVQEPPPGWKPVRVPVPPPLPGAKGKWGMRRD